MTVDEQIGRLIDRTISESFDGVEPVRHALQAAQQALRDGDEHTARTALGAAARTVSDEWPHSSTLGSDVLGFVQAQRGR